MCEIIMTDGKKLEILSLFYNNIQIFFEAYLLSDLLKILIVFLYFHKTNEMLSLTSAK